MTTSTTTTEHDSAFSRALVSVILVGAVSAVVGFALGGARTGASVLLGASVAAANLWAIRLIGRGLLSKQKSSVPWGLVAALKLSLLLLGLYLVAKSGVFEMLPLVIGYGALPLGIASSQLGTPRALRGRS